MCGNDTCNKGVEGNISPIRAVMSVEFDTDVFVVHVKASGEILWRTYTKFIGVEVYTCN